MSSNKIMIVEDNTTVAMDCRSCLENLGYGVTSIVASGEESIQRAETERPDAVLMDIRLRDEMDGVEAAEQIYTRFEIPVVFLSAYSDPELLERARKVGSFGYMVKPFTERELNAMLEMALYKSNADKERRQMEERLQQAHKMETIGTLAGGIAHDFNNLLGSISGFIELSRNISQPGSENDSFLSEAMKSCIQARNLTRKFLLLSKASAPIREAGDIAESIDQFTDMALSGENVKCEYHISEDLWAADFDEGQIGQVFSNIVINAKEAMPDGGKITVEADNVIIGDKNNINADKGQYLKISIKDHGCGIASEDLERIFDPYFSTKTSFGDKGMGLGLATALSIIKKHEGDIQAESKIGVGTTIIIYIPAYKKESVAIQPEKIQVSEETAVGSKKILLLDDEESLSFCTMALLDILGHKAECFNDGVEAIEAYKNAKETGEPFDVVILDLTIKDGLGGKETIQKLIEIDPDVKGIAASGFSYDPIMSNFKEYGFCEALPKPYLKVELANAIERVFKSIDL